MGNIGSQSGNISQPLPVEEEQKWAHSFPRNPPKLYQHKVLPDRDAPLKLRPTNNGEILQSGGTLSGRHHQHRLSFEDKSYGVYRSSSISSSRPNDSSQNERPRSPTMRAYASNHKDLHKSGQKYVDQKNSRGPYGNRREQMKRFGSEPDLREASSRTLDIQDRSKGRKKYRAPPPPPMMDKSSDSWDADSEPARRARLFKTRAETKKKSSPVNNRRSLENEPKQKKDSFDSNAPDRSKSRENSHPANRLSLPEMKRSNSIPEFQAELKEATKRLRSAKILEDSDTPKKYLEKDDSEVMKSKLKTLDHNISRKDVLRNKLKQLEEKENIIDPPREKEPPPPRKQENTPKMFYFGMEENHNNSMPRSFPNNTIVDHFVSTLHTHTNVPLNSSGSDISSEMDLGESHISGDGIALQLRPILPKKQFEIPRFSPATAWKLLSAVESNHAPSTAPSDDVPMFIEERIEKLSRLPPPPTVQDGPRSSHDKSGDSGISGDAGPPGFDEADAVPQNLPPISNFRPTGVSWTPQQDLGDDSSIEEGLQGNQPVFSSSMPRFSPRPHVFSLSLPRDNHLASYLGEKSGIQAYSGLQKLKRSVSGVLNNFGQPTSGKKDVFQSNSNQDQSDNWFLSKSAPNSLNNGFNSLELKSSRKFEEEEQPVLLNQSQHHGRVMYLPKLDENLRLTERNGRYETNNRPRDRSRSADRSKLPNKMSLLSKSCENISTEIKSSSEPEDLQDPPKSEDKWRNKKPKRFTFQSTVRQIERKRLAEKLSREAEKKEKQRLRELEAMQKVEEEFQKKRAREKATIRQQLRLFSMDDVAWSSLPPNINSPKDNDMMHARQDPDGAVSSSTPSPTLVKEETIPKRKSIADIHLREQSSSSDSSEENNKLKATSTKILSEYRQPQREYKDFRGRYHAEFSEPKETIHPQVTYQMPMAHAYQSSSGNLGKSSNYRKNFAHGKKNSKSGGSTYSEDSQSNVTNHTPMMYHSKNAPITRF